MLLMYKIFIILVIILIVGFNLNDLCRQQLEGLYTGDADFLEKSDLKEFILYLGKSNSAYLTMIKSNGDVIFNDKIKYKNKLYSAFCLLLRNKIIKSKINISIDGSTSLNNTIPFPSSLNYEFCLTTGRLTLYKGNKKYAILIKDNVASSMF